MEGIAEAFVGVIGNGVHGEVTAKQVFCQVFCEGDLVGVAAVGIFPIYTVGGHFVVFLVEDDCDGAVLDAGVEGVVEEGLRFFRQGGGGDIPVLGDTSQNGIADTAADDISLVAAFIQFI